MHAVYSCFLFEKKKKNNFCTDMQILHQMWQRDDIRGVFTAMEKMYDGALSIL